MRFLVDECTGSRVAILSNSFLREYSGWLYWLNYRLIPMNKASQDEHNAFI
jgi:hypothetical protein